MTLTTRRRDPSASSDLITAASALTSAQRLREAAPRVAEHWTQALHALSGSSYSVCPTEELRATRLQFIAACVQLLEADDTELLWQYVERLCQQRAAMNFPPSEITEAIMLFLESAEAVMGPEISDRWEWSHLMRDYRYCTRVAMKVFADMYLLHLEMAGNFI